MSEQEADSNSSQPQKGLTWDNAVDIVKSLYPNLFARTYLVPPVHFNKVSYVRRNVPLTGLSVLELGVPLKDAPPKHDPLPPIQPSFPETTYSLLTKVTQTPVPAYESDQRHDFAQTHVTLNLQALGESRNEVMFIVTQCNFINYLNKSAYKAAAEKLPRPQQYKPEEAKYSDCEADILVIHRQHGILIGEIKSVGQNRAADDDDVIKRVKQAATQLDRSAKLVRFLVKDITPGLAVRKTIFLPSISSKQLERILTANPDLNEKIMSCLGAANAADATLLTCCFDQLSDPASYWRITPDVLSHLDCWWHRRMASTAGPELTDEQYADIVTRFVGPATTVEVHCDIPPRVEVRTVGEAVAELGRRLVRLILAQEQLALMNRDPSRVCITGPPGTGKTLVLVLQGLRWLLQEKNVHIVSTCLANRAVSTLIERQLQLTVIANPTRPQGQAILHMYDFSVSEEEVTKAVEELTSTEGGSLCVILDETIFDKNSQEGARHQSFVTQLIARHAKLRLWTACIEHTDIPQQLQQEIFTTPLRCAPVVLREVKPALEKYSVHNYSDTYVPSPGDGMSVVHLYHEGVGHTGLWPVECHQCGTDVAAELRRLGVGTEKSGIHYHDIFVLTRSTELKDQVIDDAGNVTSPASGVVQGLREQNLPLCVLGQQTRKQNEKKWQKDFAHMVIAKTNSITVAGVEEVSGLERKIVVTLQGQRRGADDVLDEDAITSHDRLYAISRCTTQLIMVHTQAQEAIWCVLQ